MEMLRLAYLVQAFIHQDEERRGTTPDTNHHSVVHNYNVVAGSARTGL